MKFLKSRWLWWPLVLSGVALGGANLWILSSTRSQIKTTLQETPQAEVGIVLGTSKETAAGNPNQYFKRRIAAASELYHAGKVRRLLLSGDNSSAGYNEPEDMRRALLAKGVPDSAMTCDYAGFRTLDTMARAKSVFGLKECLVITDDFHLPRAIFLTNFYNLKASGFQTKPLPWNISSTTRLREYLARVKMVLDLYVLRTKPKFGGA